MCEDYNKAVVVGVFVSGLGSEETRANNFYEERCFHCSSVGNKDPILSSRPWRDSRLECISRAFESCTRVFRTDEKRSPYSLLPLPVLCLGSVQGGVVWGFTNVHSVDYLREGERFGPEMGTYGTFM